MQTDYLREFVLLSRSLSFNETARKLHISQSALSKHISALEREFDAQLINRLPAPSLTPSGEILLEHSQAILNLVEQARSKIEEEAKSIRATIRIKLPNASDASTQELLSCIGEFKREHPNINVAVMPSSDEDPIKAIRAGKLDGGMYCMLAFEPDAQDQGLIFAPLCDDAVIAWVDANSSQGQREHLKPEDLSGLRLPIPSKSQTANAEMFVSSFIRHFGVDSEMVLVAENSIEDFLIQHVSREDAILLMDSTSYDSAMMARRDRVIKRFDPDVILTTYYAFDAGHDKAPDDPHRRAVQLFRDFMESRYVGLQQD